MYLETSFQNACLSGCDLDGFSLDFTYAQQLRFSVIIILVEAINFDEECNRIVAETDKIERPCP